MLIAQMYKALWLSVSALLKSAVTLKLSIGIIHGI